MSLIFPSTTKAAMVNWSPQRGFMPSPLALATKAKAGTLMNVTVEVSVAETEVDLLLVLIAQVTATGLREALAQIEDEIDEAIEYSLQEDSVAGMVVDPLLSVVGTLLQLVESVVHSDEIDHSLVVHPEDDKVHREMGIAHMIYAAIAPKATKTDSAMS